MNAEVTGAARAESRSTSLALASVVVWLAAAASAGRLGIWLAIGGASVALGAAVLVFDRPAATALLRPSATLVLAGAIAGALMAAATHLLYPALARLLPFLTSDTARLYAAFRAPSRAVATAALIPIIIGEELVWRGVVQTWLVRRLGAWGGVTLAAGAYALVHAPVGSPVLVAVAFGCGVVWGALRGVSGSLVPSLVAHVVWDVVVLLGLPLDAR